MSYPKVRYTSAIYPRNGSDFCIHATITNDDNCACIFGVVDILGRAEKKIKAIIQGRFETLLESQSEWNMDVLTEAVDKEILTINNDIRKIGMKLETKRLHKNRKQYSPSNLFHRLISKFTLGRLIAEGGNEVTIADNDMIKEPDDGFIYGSTLTLILICDNECQLYHFGDSRLYRLRSVNNKRAHFESPCEVKCLTTDHNLLAEMMEKRGFVGTGKLKKLNKNINSYLGMNEASLNSYLSKANRRFNYEKGDWFIFMTDGLFLPIIRGLAGIGVNVSKEDFYIENWLKEFIYFGSYFHPLSMNGKPRLLVKDLLNRVRNSSIYKHHKDDIAVMVVQLM